MFKILSRYHPHQRKEAMISHAVHYSSHLTWKRLSDNLQKRGYTDTAVLTLQKYGKGQLRVCVHVHGRTSTCMISVKKT